MKKVLQKLSFILPLLVASFLVLPAYGATKTLTGAQLAAFVFNAGSSSGVSGTPTNVQQGAGAFYSINWTVASNGVGVNALFDSAGIPAISSGDTFELSVLNSNASPWTWTVRLFNAVNASLGTDSVNPNPNAADTISILVGAGGPVDRIELDVSGSFAGDLNSNAKINVPEPSSAVLLLFGTGGLAFVGQLRRRLGR